jgi:hypothetical protein
MTDRKVTYSLTKIRTCKERGYDLEALIRTYHLNLDIIRYLLHHMSPRFSLEGKKVKIIVNELLKEIDHKPSLKTIIHKRSIKTLKPWLEKMDLFFKGLKLRQPSNINALQDESEKIFGMLKISANKLLIKK